MRRIISTSLTLLLLIGLGLPLAACEEEEREIPPRPGATATAEDEEKPEQRRGSPDLRESGNSTIGKAKQTAENTVGDLERRSREIAGEDDE